MLTVENTQLEGDLVPREPRSRDEDGPNLTPVLDTIFLVLAVLLVVFVKLTPVEGLPAVLGPDGGRATSYERSQRVEVELSAEGHLQVNGRGVPPGNLAAVVAERSRRPGVDAVYLLAHADVPYGAVAEVLVLLQHPDHPPIYLGMTKRNAAEN